jgi:FlaA1/EpsC-like NDP-sugar epimerase
MGATKRFAEEVVSALSKESKTVFLAVRFGNVLGSRGSVIPLFRKQIAAGGPVTVTHPDVERYFMTIPEAVTLVLEAGAIGSTGQLFLLDMGDPIRISDLARRMIVLSGFEPDVDIEIVYTGLRPGEKLTEELLTDEENLESTEHPKIFVTHKSAPALDQIKTWLRELDDVARNEGDPKVVVQVLQRIIPSFRPPEIDAPGL